MMGDFLRESDSFVDDSCLRRLEISLTMLVEAAFGDESRRGGASLQKNLSGVMMK